MRFLLLLLLPATVFAKNYADIPSMYYQVSGEKEVPADLLYAITLTESNLKTNKGRILPWPWSVNHRGTPYRFATREDMHRFCQSLLNKGDLLFDVGGAQVNWYWHSKRFKSLWDATDPLTNLRSAGEYLRESYISSGDWWVAVGKYHNPSDENKASEYRLKVKGIWREIKKQRVKGNE